MECGQLSTVAGTELGRSSREQRLGPLILKISLNTIVIGAGQAGLSLSYHLTQQGIEHLVLERARRRPYRRWPIFGANR